MIEGGMRERSQGSKYLVGSPGHIVSPADFDPSNVLMNPREYSYEGNWLFCSFSQPDLPAARIGFGRGKFDWRDYGLESLPVSQDAFFYRVEIVRGDGLYACVLSDPSLGSSVQSDPARMHMALDWEDHRVFSLEGWPRSSWRFQNIDGSLRADLMLDTRNLVVWPDMLLPGNTFAMSVGTGPLSGTVELEGDRIVVDGVGFYDHPRTVIEHTGGPAFGWYLYAPVCFADGTHVLSYHCRDGSGRKDSVYSQGILVRPDGRRFWLTDSSVHGLSLNAKGLPQSWQCELTGSGALVRYRVKIVELRLLHGWGDAAPDAPPGKYPALPLLMKAEGECEIGGVRSPLSNGTGIAEFVVRTGYEPGPP